MWPFKHHNSTARMAVVFAMIGAAFSARSSFAQTISDEAELRKYPSSYTYSGRSGSPDFLGRDREYKDYRTRIRNSLSEGVNFAGQFALVTFGCGTGCAMGFVSDVRSGRVFSLPFGGEDTPYIYKLKYNANSRALIMYWNPPERCMRQAMIWEGEYFRMFEPQVIGRGELCSSESGALRQAAEAVPSQPQPSTTASPRCNPNENYWSPQNRIAAPCQAHFSEEKSPAVATAPSPPSSTPTPAARLSATSNQAALIEAVSRARNIYSSGENDMAKGSARPIRAQAICSSYSTVDALRWSGKVAVLSSNSDGYGVLAVDIGDEVLLKTWNNALSDALSDTLINPKSQLFEKAVRLKVGQKVEFSGIFFRSKEDCFKEGSLTLKGSITNPEFIFKFSDIKPE